jgi:polyisoprenoid-binding protein YceI
MKHRRVVILGISAWAMTSVVRASAGLSSAGDSTVKFEAQGPAGMKINGTSGGVRAAEADGKIKIVAPTTGFQTGIGLRDKHLRDYLESDKMPEAVLVVDRTKITLPTDAATTGSVTADLSLHGVTRPTKVGYRITRGPNGYQVHGSITSASDFKIKKPCYLGVCGRGSGADFPRGLRWPCAG